MTPTVYYLLDTDTCIYLLNGHEGVKQRVAEVGVEVIAVTVVTKGELYFGAYNSSQVEHNLKRIQNFFATPGPAVLPLDENALDNFGKFKAELRRKAQPIGDIDLLIASTSVRKFVPPPNASGTEARFPSWEGQGVGKKGFGIARRS